MLGEGTKERTPWEGRVKLGQRIVHVDASRPPVVALTFADGFVAMMNLQRLLDIGSVFAPLRDPDFFRKARAGNGGGSLEWVASDGTEIDLCADSLRMEAEGIWDPETRQWIV